MGSPVRADLPLTRDLVLVGGGHAHALVLRRWGMDPLPGVRLTLVNPGAEAPYTGMLPGHVAGHYDRDEIHIDLVRLARFAGAAFVDGAVSGIDPWARVLDVAGRGPLPYDVASIDVGVSAEMPDLPGFAEHAVAAKPLGPFAARWRAFREARAAGKAPAEVAVIGGGVAGVELAMAMAHALRADGADPRVAVIEAAGDITGTSRGAKARLCDAMAATGVALRTDATVERIEAGRVVLASGEAIPAAFVAGTAGARAHGWLARGPLPTERGFVRVGPTLQVEGHPALFAAGDCAHLTHAPRPKAGVYAVREAPVLHRNLRAALSGGRMRRYRPQRRYLKLVSLGGRSAVAERNGLALAHPVLWRWKDRIDRRFMDRLRDLPMMTSPPLPDRVADGVREALDGRPLCGGCGAKVAAPALARALDALPPPARPDTLSRPGDDAAVLAHGNGRQVLTTDHLRAVTDDLHLMGRIAAVHALGDVWAMGAAPQAALASVTLPRMSEALQARALASALAGMGAVLAPAGADLVGGHSTMGAETVLGLTLTGLLDGPATGHDGARPDDAIVLTRPIGTGTLLAAAMAGAARGRDVMAALEVMATPQGDAAAILAGARAMTDVTGFGLAGHLANLCRASGIGAVLDLSAIPAYDGAPALAWEGHRSSLHASNAAAAPVAGAEGAVAALLHDPQTAGGLLAALPADAGRIVVDRLRAAGHRAAVIGRFEAGPPRIRVG